MDTLPVSEWDGSFNWTVYRHRKTGEAVGCERSTWSAFCEDRYRFGVSNEMVKDVTPAIIHGLTSSGARKGVDYVTSEALLIDVDHGARRPCLEALGDIDYFYEERVMENGEVKFHLIIPYAEPLRVEECPLENATARAKHAAEVIAYALGIPDFDRSVLRPVSLCICYCKRPDSSDPYFEWVDDSGNALDLTRLLQETGYNESLIRRGSTLPTKVELTNESNELLKAFNELGWVFGKRHDGGWNVKCPRYEELGHHDTGATKTMFRGNRLTCLSDSCRGKPLSWFTDALPEPQRSRVRSAEAQDVYTALAARNVARSTPAEAQARIQQALEQSRPFERTATVLRVSTGAGKTYAASHFLNRYSAPGPDGDSGRTAVFGTPTNALLDEVRARITVPYKKQVGVLAVLNDDGTPACRKHDEAKRLQDRGGNVHQLMCSACEFKDGCPARAGRVVGLGSLTLTNHTLVPSVVKDLREAGRIPLVIWDECPPMVEFHPIRTSELDWMLEQFDREAFEETQPVTLTALDRVPLYSTKYRAALRPLMEVLRHLRRTVKATGEVDLAAVAEDWHRMLHSQAVLGSAERLHGLTGAGLSVWGRVRAVALAGAWTNVSTIPFDRMRAEDQERMLRAASIHSVLAALLTDGATVQQSVTTTFVTTLTEAGRIWRDQGGVVLDATAPLTVLKAIRPDCVVEDIRVDDGGEIERVLKWKAFGRTTLREAKKNDPEKYQKMLKEAGRMVRSRMRGVEARVGHVPKTVVFTYKFLVEDVSTMELPPEVEFHHFGNTRGYDHWFKEGFELFVTLGDPYVNKDASDAVIQYLFGDDEVAGHRFFREGSESETAQAHGRARDPQPGVFRSHLHLGRTIPVGWDALGGVCVEV